MKPRVTYDPRDPKFPHGTTRGRRRGCTCPPCMTAMQNAQREQRNRRDAKRALRNTSHVPAAPAVEHLRKLNATEWGVHGNLVSATGLHSELIRRLLKSETKRSVAYLTERVILSIDVDRLRRAAVWCPFRIAEQRVRSLQAQGWPLTWQADQLGHAGESRPPFLENSTGYVTRDIYDRVAELYERVGDRRGPCAKAARNAARNGWYPAIHYDDDGRLVPEGIRRDEKRLERLARREKAAEGILNIIRWSLAGETAMRIADWIPGMTERQVQRVRTDVGLRLSHERDADGMQQPAADDDARRRMQEVRAIVEAHDARADRAAPGDDTSAWRTVHYDLGLMNSKKWAWDAPAPGEPMGLADDGMRPAA